MMDLQTATAAVRSLFDVLQSRSRRLVIDWWDPPAELTCGRIMQLEPKLGPPKPAQQCTAADSPSRWAFLTLARPLGYIPADLSEPRAPPFVEAEIGLRTFEELPHS